MALISSSARNARNKITLPAGFLAVPYQPKAVYQINDKQPEVEYDVIDDDDDDDEDNNNSIRKRNKKMSKKNKKKKVVMKTMMMKKKSSRRRR